MQYLIGYQKINLNFNAFYSIGIHLEQNHPAIDEPNIICRGIFIA